METIMTSTKAFAIAACALLCAGLIESRREAQAFATAAHLAPVDAGGASPIPVQMPGLIELFSDDDYIHDRHYDWEQYRNATSRKERVRDYYQMQKDVQKDYWRQQKEMQKNMIKRQRGW
jgi:hypothetical protein